MVVLAVEAVADGGVGGGGRWWQRWWCSRWREGSGDGGLGGGGGRIRWCWRWRTVDTYGGVRGGRIAATTDVARGRGCCLFFVGFQNDCEFVRKKRAPTLAHHDSHSAVS